MVRPAHLSPTIYCACLHVPRVDDGSVGGWHCSMVVSKYGSRRHTTCAKLGLWPTATRGAELDGLVMRTKMRGTLCTCLIRNVMYIRTSLNLE